MKSRDVIYDFFVLKKSFCENISVNKDFENVAVCAMENKLHLNKSIIYFVIYIFVAILSLVW